MSNSNKLNQRINLQFLFKLGKTNDEAFRMLKLAYGDRCLSHTFVRDYFKKMQDLTVEEIENVSMNE